MKSSILVYFLVTCFCSSVFGVCYNDICKRECTAKGYDGGTCDNGYCSCYKSGYSLEDIKPLEIHDASEDINRFNLEDIKPQNFQDVSEDKNKIPLLRRMGICYDWQCNYQCRNKGKRGGYCSFGTCYCYG